MVHSRDALIPTQQTVKPGLVYIDCEFDGHDGPLLSIGLVKDDGDSIHIRADVEPMDLWVRQNVLPVMDAHRAPQSVKVYHNEVGGVIRAFLGDIPHPVIVADSPVDIGRFCRALSTGADGGWASADYPGMTFEVRNVDCYPTALVGAVQHNAWWDAMALRCVLTTPTPSQAQDGYGAARSEAGCAPKNEWRPAKEVLSPEAIKRFKAKKPEQD